MHQRASGASTSAWRSTTNGKPPRKPAPPIHVNGTRIVDQPWVTNASVIEPWPSSQPVVQYQIWSPPW